MRMDIKQEIGQALTILRQRRPLIHHITNFVTMTDCANVTLAIGASPTMTNAVEEVGEMASAAAALVLNLGTLQSWTIEAMMIAGKAAAAAGIPIVLDPVGAGGTTFRTQAALQLVQTLPITVIRGNLSEMTCLAAGRSGHPIGVDNQDREAVTLNLAQTIAQRLGTTIVITGPQDAVSDGTKSVLLGNGTDLLTYVTGTGCMTTSLIASFAAVTEPFIAAAAGVMTMGLAGEMAMAHGGDTGPGTFHQHLFDAVYALDTKQFCSSGKVLMYHE